MIYMRININPECVSYLKTICIVSVKCSIIIRCISVFEGHIVINVCLHTPLSRLAKINIKLCAPFTNCIKCPLSAFYSGDI